MEIIEIGKDWYKSLQNELGNIVYAVDSAMEVTAQSIKLDFEASARTWTHKPQFNIIHISPKEIEISTTDINYVRVNDGTKAHPITPRNGKLLAFEGRAPKSPQNPSRFRAYKTTEGGMYFAKRVNHPGSTPREWDTAIQFFYEGLYQEGKLIEIVREYVAGRQVPPAAFIANSGHFMWQANWRSFRTVQQHASAHGIVED